MDTSLLALKDILPDRNVKDKMILIEISLFG